MFKKFVFYVLIFGLIGTFSTVVLAQDATPRPVIIDSDMSTDDWMATLLTFKNSDFDVKAITVTGTGFAYCDAGTQIALGLIELAQVGNIPVSCWRDTPLFGDNAVPEDWRTTVEKAAALNLPAGGETSDMNAVELFTETLESSPEKLTVLALGPLTNVGAALDANPSLVDKIDTIYVMGGAVDVLGSFVSTENSTAEWNIYGDPYAARLVFESGAPIVLVPLDATNDVPVTVRFMDLFKTAQDTPEAQFVYQALSANLQSIKMGGYFFWDPLTAMVMSDPEIVTLTVRTVSVVDVPGPEDGRTKPVGNGPQIQVATNPDAAAFEELFIERLNS